MGHRLKTYGRVVADFARTNWLGTLVIFLATIVFFWPIVTRIGTYSAGGDAMFNAWTLARDQHCILRQGCPHYADGNIYFPNKDTMLYSETQLSAGLAGLPLFLINQNPVFEYNVYTILSFFLGGWFMYLLAKRLSKGNELFSIFAGLIFEFAPFKMAGIWHLQNLSIFCLPLAVLLLYKFFDHKNKKLLIPLFIVLLYQFYASWYQMVFVLIALGIFLLAYGVFRLQPWRPIIIALGVMLFAALCTLPLAKQYVAFSKTNKASFGVIDQTLYSSSLEDYFIPNDGTLIGKAYYHLRPGAQHNSYNLDSFSYSGIVLYGVSVFVIVRAFLDRKKNAASKQRHKQIWVFVIIGLVGFVMSLGPLLKVKGSYVYGHLSNGTGLAVPLPYILVDKFFHQLSFIRAVGRAHVLFLFMLCCIWAIMAIYLAELKYKTRTKQIIAGLLCALVVIELMPAHLVPMDKNSYHYNLQIPAVYKYIKSQPQIDDIFILQSRDYPNVSFEYIRSEDTLWAGYHNRNIFNGYSGYTPPQYMDQFVDFVNFAPDDIPKMKALGLRYILLDKQLTPDKPQAVTYVRQLTKVYEDNRYALFKI